MESLYIQKHRLEEENQKQIELIMENPKISLIVAIDKNRGIGKDNGLLWHIPDELKRFREITTGYPIIMGRKTYESIGRPLPNRTNIIITRDPNFAVEGAVVVNSLEQALAEASNPPNASSPSEIFIIGGGQIFKETMDKNLADKLYLTIVELSPSTSLRTGFSPTVFFPEYKHIFTKKVFEKTIEAEGKKDEAVQKFKVTFLELEK